MEVRETVAKFGSAIGGLGGAEEALLGALARKMAALSDDEMLAATRRPAPAEGLGAAPIESDATESDAIGSDATESDATESDATESDAVTPKLDESDAVTPKLDESDAVTPTVEEAAPPEMKPNASESEG